MFSIDQSIKSLNQEGVHGFLMAVCQLYIPQFYSGKLTKATTFSADKIDEREIMAINPTKLDLKTPPD